MPWFKKKIIQLRKFEFVIHKMKNAGPANNKDSFSNNTVNALTTPYKKINYFNKFEGK